MTEHGRLARAALEAGKHVLVEKPVATSLADAEQVLAAAEAAPGQLVCAPHILLSPTYRAMHARVRAGEIGGLLTARGRYGWAGPGLGPLVLRAGRRRAVRPRHLQRHEPVRVLRPRPARDRDDRRRDPRAARRRRADPRPGGGQRARADRLRRRPLRGRHDRLHDAAATARPASSCTARTACCRCSATTGRRRATSCGATTRRHGSCTRSDPSWPWTDGLRHLVECLETGAGAGHAARARLPRARDHARRAGGRRRRPRARDPQRLPGARPRAARRRRRRPRAASTTPGARHEPGRAPAPPPSSPRPAFDGPALIRRADVTRHVWGDPAAGEVYDWIYASTEQVHMLVFGLPPGGGFRHSEDFRTIFAADELLHVLQGTLVIADPETGEVQRAAAGESVFFRRDTWHHAFALGPEPLRVLELFAPAAGRRRVERLRPRPAVPGDVALRRRRAARRLAPRAAAGAAPARAAARRRALAPRPRRAVRGAGEHRAPHGRDARARPGRGRPRCTSTAATRC